MDRNRHVAIWLRMLAKKEIAESRNTFHLLKTQGAKIASAYQKDGRYGVERAIEKGQEQWVRVFVALFSTTIRQFKEYIKTQLPKKKEIKEIKANFLDRALAYVSAQAYMKSKYVTATNHEIVKNVISHGIEKGLSEVQIAKNIKTQFVDIPAKSRARTIARTEVHLAAGYGMQSGAEEAEIPLMMREWVTVEDERTRPEHLAADTQKRGMDEPFDVGGEQMDFPGDGSDPGNNINCRCTIIYIPADTNFSGGGNAPPGTFIGEE